MSSLTIAYITARRDPRIEWFHDSLVRQSDVFIPVILVDLFPHERGELTFGIKHVPPKPNVWQGEYRLTKEDWFAAANARNTALCLCETDWIAYADDLSVLMPEWLSAVNSAMEGGYIVCGAYRKVKNLIVENGVAVSYEMHPEGRDDRWERAAEEVSSCNGNWLFGCSCAFPVEDLLQVGGWPEYCDSLGSEDYCLGHALTNAGKKLKYDKRMLTLESEELHYVEKPLRRMDKGESPRDKSHAALRMAKQTSYFANYYPGGMRALRTHVLKNGKFPVLNKPTHDWWDSQPIAQMV